MKDTIDDMTKGVVTVLENQIDAEATNKDTNERLKRVLTLKQFIGGLIVMWILCSFAGKYISGRYWFDTAHKEALYRQATYESMDKFDKIDVLTQEITRLESKRSKIKQFTGTTKN